MQKLEFTQLQFLTQNTPSMFCFDFDGTLADIVDNYEEVIFEPKTHINIKELSQKYFVSILTGRSLENIKNIINIPGLTYVGNHGLEIQFNASLSWQHPNIPLQQIKTIKQQLNSCFYNIPGVFIEDKGLTLALHFRKVNEKNLNSIHTKATSILKKHPKIHFFMGKKVINITPKVKWNKGKSLAKIIEIHNLTNYMPIYFGDDSNDEEAFTLVNELNGISVYVGSQSNRSSAKFYIESPKDLRELIKRIIK